MNRLSVVVEDFVASLSDERKVELKNILLSPMMSSSWPWYEEVINRYLKGPDTKALMDDIELHYPGSEFGNAVSEYQDIHAYEVGKILWEAQKAVGK
jgi:hypothetical protein